MGSTCPLCSSLFAGLRITCLHTRRPIGAPATPPLQVVSKMSLLVDLHGPDEAMAMLLHLEHRMRTKQGVMKNGPGYLDVAVSSHLDMLKVRPWAGAGGALCTCGASCSECCKQWLPRLAIARLPGCGNVVTPGHAQRKGKGRHADCPGSVLGLLGSVVGLRNRWKVTEKCELS